MALDMAKYRKLFLEEATDHLGDISSALLELEKDTASVESIDVVFRMAHSIKSMAASLGFDSVTEVAHRLEDRMQDTRERGCLANSQELSLLFKGLEGMEQMVAVIRETGEAPPADPGLLEALMCPIEVDEVSSTEPVISAAPEQSSAAPKKKVLN